MGPLSPEGETRTRRTLLFLLKAALTVLVTYFLFRSLRLSWGEIRAMELSGWRPRALPLLLSVSLILLAYSYLVYLWSRLVADLGGTRLGFATAFRIFFLANVARYVPGKLWQLASLTYLAAREGVGPAVGSSGAILAQIFQLGAAVLVGAAGLALAAPGAADLPGGAWTLLAVIGLLVVILTPRLLPWLLERVFQLVGREGRLSEMGPGFGARWLLAHVPAWIAYSAAFGFLWRTFDPLPSVDWMIAGGAFASAYVLGYVALFAPAGIGVREGVLAVLLAPAMGAPRAAVLAVIARLWITAAEVLPLAGLGVSRAFRWFRHRSQSAGGGETKGRF